MDSKLLAANERYDPQILNYLTRILLIGGKALCQKSDPAVSLRKTSDPIVIGPCESSSFGRRSFPLSTA